MKKISLFMFIAFFLAGALISIPQISVHAQDPICTDAAGGVIPCPPTAEIPCGQAGGPDCPPPSGEENNDNGNKKPTSIPPATATATNTPLPLMAFPTSTAINQPPGLTPEVTPFATLPPTTTPEADSSILISPQDNGSTGGNDDWDESCSWASCFAYDIMCWADGGSGYGQDDGAGGTVYHCDMPEDTDSTTPPSAWLPWLGLTTGVILIGLLVPAVQKIRESAARTKSSRSARMPNIKNPDLTKNQEDGDDDEAFTRYQRRSKRSE